VKVSNAAYNVDVTDARTVYLAIHRCLFRAAHNDVKDVCTTIDRAIVHVVA